MTAPLTGTTLQRLEQWYQGQCNGDWEHSYGVTIATLDNPGWSVVVELRETALEDKPFAEYKRDYDDEREWIICVVRDTKFEGHCGPQQLDAMIEVFLTWAEQP